MFHWKSNQAAYGYVWTVGVRTWVPALAISQSYTGMKTYHTPVIFYVLVFVERKTGSKRTLRKAPVSISLLTVVQAPSQCLCTLCPAMKLWLREFHVRLPLTRARWKAKEGIQELQEELSEKPQLESWGAVYSYLCSNSGRNVSWADL